MNKADFITKMENRQKSELKEAEYFDQKGNETLKLVHEEKAKVYGDISWMIKSGEISITDKLEEYRKRELTESEYFDQKGNETLKLVHDEKAKIYGDTALMIKSADLLLTEADLSFTEESVSL